MTVSAEWEERLVELANAGLNSEEPYPAVPSSIARLEQAFEHCERITARHSRTFYFASGLLPHKKRRAVRALYAFCRTTDDIVDLAQDNSSDALDDWRSRVICLDPPADDPTLLAWAKARADYQIPAEYCRQLIDGVGRDLKQSRYESFDDLAEYCYGVASTVGLMSMHIIGFEGPEAVPYAVKMGVALQMTNILRDIGEDWRNGRLYLPREDLDAFGLSEDEIASGRVDENWRLFMRDQIERVHRLYDESWPGIAWLHRDGQFSIAAAADLYRAILGAIVDNDFDSFHHRAHIGMLGKLVRLPRIWGKVRRLRMRTAHSRG